MKRSIVILVAVLAAMLLPGTARAASTVCSVNCDTRDPSLARQDTFPVADRIQNNRRISLHLSDADAMAWGSIDNGSAGDTVWLDRTFDGGTTWDGLLGKAAIPSTWTGTRTLMYNLADPVNHARGMVRACGDAAGVQCTDWVHPQACDQVCDGAPIGGGDRQPVPATSWSGRTVALHVDDRGMAWGTIAGGASGDEIWLDRSWNEGAGWPGGSLLGRTTATRTSLFATRDVGALLYGGAVRACGRAVTDGSISCTGWARPGGDRAAAAADVLAYAYRTDTAWWPSSWWNSAVAVTTLTDWMKRSGRSDYRWLVDRTYEQNKGVIPAGQKSGDAIEGHFISRSIDDAGWWGLAWIAAYDLTGDQKYLTEATTIANYLNQNWDPSTCGGGVWWDRERTYKNAVTTGLYIRLAASLHNRIAGDTTWRSRAVTGWNWFTGSGMINGAGLVNDGLTAGCGNNGGTVWSYNQGLAIGAGVEVYRATGDVNALNTARRLADAAMNNSALTQNGILTEACDAAGQSCDDNAKQFKGIFMRFLGDLADITGTATYRTYAKSQADSIWNRDRDALNRIGTRWNGTASPADWRTQASGLGALIAATDGGTPSNPPPATPPTTPPPTTPPPTNPPPAGTAWAPGVAYQTGQVVTYGGSSWRCRQPHTSLVGWEPPNVPALWQAI
jgi:hypothetical protein